MYSRTLTNTEYAQHLPGGFRAPSLDEEFVKEHVARKRDACVIKAVMSILSISQLPAAHTTSNDAGITLAAAIRWVVCLHATLATSNGAFMTALMTQGY